MSKRKLEEDMYFNAQNQFPRIRFDENPVTNTREFQPEDKMGRKKPKPSEPSKPVTWRNDIPERLACKIVSVYRNDPHSAVESWKAHKVAYPVIRSRRMREGDFERVQDMVADMVDKMVAEKAGARMPRELVRALWRYKDHVMAFVQTAVPGCSDLPYLPRLLNKGLNGAADCEKRLVAAVVKYVTPPATEVAEFADRGHEEMVSTIRPIIERLEDRAYADRIILAFAIDIVTRFGSKATSIAGRLGRERNASGRRIPKYHTNDTDLRRQLSMPNRVDDLRRQVSLPARIVMPM
jgi:hypothetical protein